MRHQYTHENYVYRHQTYQQYFDYGQNNLLWALINLGLQYNIPYIKQLASLYKASIVETSSFIS